MTEPPRSSRFVQHKTSTLAGPQEQARRQNLNPLERGPLGNISKTTPGPTATRSATDAILPPAESAVTGGEHKSSHIAARDPALASALVRQGVADRANVVLGRNQGGPNQWGGAKFAQEIAGTEQQRANLTQLLTLFHKGLRNYAALDGRFASGS